MALDLDNSYKEVKDKISSAKAYTDLKSQYDSLKKSAGDSFDEKKDLAEQKINDLKANAKKYQKELKNQFEQLIDIKKVLAGKGGNTTKYLKRILMRTLRKIEPKIANILMTECLSVVGCDQQQAYSAGNAGQVLYIRVGSIDLGKLLRKDYQTSPGKALYEKQSLSATQSYPYPMNKQLYQRIQSNDPYSTDSGGSLYMGRSGQPLFDIEYTEVNDLGETGSFYKVTLQQRVTLNRLNNVSEFIQDYYKTIKVVDFNSTLSWILECMLGVISIKGDIGLKQVEDVSKVMAIIQRILGICFDNRKTIDVSGISKLSEIDDTDNSFYELNSMDLRKIEERVSNIKNGVVKFVTCNDIALPLDTNTIFEALDNITFIEDEDKQIDAADKLTDDIANNPDWNGFAIDGSLKAELDLNFLKNMIMGLALSLFSPKILLPLAIMLKALGKSILETIKSFSDFVKRFATFFKNVVSKIAGIFIKELFKEIKKDIRNLIQSILVDLAKEKAAKQISVILKLIQLLITVGQFIRDWRECKSVVDEILWLLKIATSAWGSGRNPISSATNNIPLPLLFAAQLLDGYSETRSFINTIQELQKVGIPTGPMPDGSPNLTVLSIYSSIKGQGAEMTNAKVQVAIPPLTMTPVGFTIPSAGYGISV